VNDIDRLLAALESTADNMLGGPEIGVLFSGGIDSCVIAELTRRRTKATLYTIGVKGSHDMVVAEKTAKRLELEWIGTEIDEVDIREAIEGIQKILGNIGPLTISFEMPLYFIAKISKQNVLTSGQGADEMFGGYARYETMDTEVRRTEMRKDIENLLTIGSPMERRLAGHFGKTIVHPFLDQNVIDVALSLPSDLIVNDGVRKVALRGAARSLGLIEEADRKKKAAQYGSGVMHMMKSMAKHDGLELRDWVASLDRSKVRQE
jgi:asparagine synthase (glutamine-hydrolysing)